MTIRECRPEEYLNCPARQANRSCWEVKKGCLCREDSSLDCRKCAVYREHKRDVMPLVERARERDEAAMSALIRHYQGFIYQIGKRFFLPGQTHDDLIQEGLLGLFLAVRNYDESKEEIFEQHVSRCIRNQIIGAVRKATQKKRKVLNGSISLDESPNGEGAINIPAPANLEEEVFSRLALQEVWVNISKGLSLMEQKIMMAHINGFSHDEIGTRLRMNSKQIENAIFRARKKVQRIRENWL
jgi:RNA polymerase sporulation-specific sigma factor